MAPAPSPSKAPSSLSRVIRTRTSWFACSRPSISTGRKFSVSRGCPLLFRECNRRVQGDGFQLATDKPAFVLPALLGCENAQRGHPLFHGMRSNRRFGVERPSSCSWPGRETETDAGNQTEARAPSPSSPRIRPPFRRGSRPSHPRPRSDPVPQRAAARQPFPRSAKVCSADAFCAALRRSPTVAADAHGAPAACRRTPPSSRSAPAPQSIGSIELNRNRGSPVSRKIRRASPASVSRAGSRKKASCATRLSDVEGSPSRDSCGAGGPAEIVLPLRSSAPAASSCPHLPRLIPESTSSFPPAATNPSTCRMTASKGRLFDEPRVWGITQKVQRLPHPS